MKLTKEQIKAEARKHGYAAHYDGRARMWFFQRLWLTTNRRAFDQVVFANLTSRLGITGRVKEKR